MVKPKAAKKSSSKASKKSSSKSSKTTSRMSTEDLSTKTVVQLKALAKKKEISLEGITKKADIIAALGGDFEGQSPKKTPKKKGKSKAKSSPLKDHSKLLEEVKDANETRNETIYLFWETFREYISPNMGEMSTSVEIVDYLFGKKIRVGGKDYQLDHPVIDEKLYTSILLLLNEAPN